MLDSHPSIPYFSTCVAHAQHEHLTPAEEAVEEAVAEAVDSALKGFEATLPAVEAQPVVAEEDKAEVVIEPSNAQEAVAEIVAEAVDEALHHFEEKLPEIENQSVTTPVVARTHDHGHHKEHSDADAVADAVSEAVNLALKGFEKTLPAIEGQSGLTPRVDRKHKHGATGAESVSEAAENASEKALTSFVATLPKIESEDVVPTEEKPAVVIGASNTEAAMAEIVADAVNDALKEFDESTLPAIEQQSGLTPAPVRRAHSKGLTKGAEAVANAVEDAVDAALNNLEATVIAIEKEDVVPDEERQEVIISPSNAEEAIGNIVAEAVNDALKEFDETLPAIEAQSVSTPRAEHHHKHDHEEHHHESHKEHHYHDEEAHHQKDKVTKADSHAKDHPHHEEDHHHEEKSSHHHHHEESPLVVASAKGSIAAAVAAAVEDEAVDVERELQVHRSASHHSVQKEGSVHEEPHRYVANIQRNASVHSRVSSNYSDSDDEQHKKVNHTVEDKPERPAAAAVRAARAAREAEAAKPKHSRVSSSSSSSSLDVEVAVESRHTASSSYASSSTEPRSHYVRISYLYLFPSPMCA